MNTKLIKFFILVTSILVIIYVNLYYNHGPRNKNLVTAPAPAIKHFTFGYIESMGDSWWLASIQNFTDCEQNRGGSSYAPSGARMGLNRTPACSFGWLYHAINLTIELIPRFYLAAANGPIALSVVVDDIDGASALFDKVIELYPYDWVILSRAASHFASEVEDRQKAAALFLRAARLGAPAWMALYASKLTSKEGMHYFSKKILMEFKDNPNLRDEDKRYIEEKLRVLNKKAE
jgi:hypothetical protein